MTPASLKADTLAAAHRELVRAGLSREAIAWAMVEVAGAYELGCVHTLGREGKEQSDFVRSVFARPQPVSMKGDRNV